MTINSGSSSLKFKLYEMPEEKVICSGNCERIGLADGIFTIKYDGKKDQTFPVFPNHEVAAKCVMDAMLEKGIISSFDEINLLEDNLIEEDNAQKFNFDVTNTNINIENGTISGRKRNCSQQ